jgi:hypothetical protein
LLIFPINSPAPIASFHQIVKRVTRDEKEVSRLLAQVRAIKLALQASEAAHDPPYASDPADALPLLPTPIPNPSAGSDILEGVPGESNMKVEAGVVADLTAPDAPTDQLSSTQLTDGAEQTNGSGSMEVPVSHVDVELSSLVPSSNIAEGIFNEPTGAPSSAPLTSEPQVLEQHLRASSASLSEALDRLSRSRAEEQSCLKKSQMEESRVEETTEWMLAMQGVLWPENSADTELGRPILPNQSPPIVAQEEMLKHMSGASDNGATDTAKASVVTSSTTEMDLEADAEGEGEGEGAEGTTSSEPVKYAFYAPVPCPPSPFSASNSKSKDFLTYGMCNALDAARLLRIIDVVDVDTTIEAFRWMAWCFRCLHILRIPPATHTLKRLLACCRPFKLADDKITKAVGGILSRSLVWKGKVRKLLFPGPRLSRPTPPLPHLNVSMDTTRLQLLITEGGMVPMTSKLKDYLVRTWDAEVLRASSLPAVSSQTAPHPQAVDGSMQSTGKAKRVPKAHAIPPVSGIAKTIIISMTGDIAESSDDDDADADGDGDAGEEDAKRAENSSASDPLKVSDESPRSSSSASSSASSSSSVPHMDTTHPLEGKKRHAYDRESARDYVYTTLSPAMWAPLPSLWPPELSVRQISPPLKTAPRMKRANTSSSSSSNRSTPTFPLTAEQQAAPASSPSPLCDASTAPRDSESRSNSS